MDKIDWEIPPPRGSRFRFLGVRPCMEDLTWIAEGVGLDRFRSELETTIQSIKPQDLARNWRNLILGLDHLSLKIRAMVYERLTGRIPMDRFRDLVEDAHEFEKDTFLAVLDSHARYFLILIPEIGEIVSLYGRLLKEFDEANVLLGESLHQSFPETEHEPDARRIVIAITLKRLKEMKGENHVE